MVNFALLEHWFYYWKDDEDIKGVDEKDRKISHCNCLKTVLQTLLRRFFAVWVLNILSHMYQILTILFTQRGKFDLQSQSCLSPNGFLLPLPFKWVLRTTFDQRRPIVIQLFSNKNAMRKTYYKKIFYTLSI